MYEKNNFGYWEKRSRVEMITNRQVVGPSLMSRPFILARSRGRRDEQVVPCRFFNQGVAQSLFMDRSC